MHQKEADFREAVSCEKATSHQHLTSHLHTMLCILSGNMQWDLYYEAVSGEYDTCLGVRSHYQAPTHQTRAQPKPAQAAQLHLT